MARHLKRLNSPKTWTIRKKGITWVAKPSSGPHGIEDCITINLMLKKLLKYAKTTKEVKNILNGGKILVDKKVRKDHKFPLGLMDVVEIPDMNEFYRILIDNKGRLYLNKIKKEEAGIKLCKIIGKKILKGKKTQLNLYDGKNILVDKDIYAVGDSVVIDLSNNKIKNHLPLKKGNLVLLIKGNHTGEVAVLEEILKLKGFAKDKILLKLKNKKVETIKDYAFVLGKDKPVIEIEK